MLFREHLPPPKKEEKMFTFFPGHLQKEGGWPCTNMLDLFSPSNSWQFANILLVLLVLVLIDCLLMCRVMFQLVVLWYVVTSLNKDTNLVPILCPMQNKVFHSCPYSSIPTLVVVTECCVGFKAFHTKPYTVVDIENRQLLTSPTRWFPPLDLHRLPASFRSWRWSWQYRNSASRIVCCRASHRAVQSTGGSGGNLSRGSCFSQL